MWDAESQYLIYDAKSVTSCKVLDNDRRLQEEEVNLFHAGNRQVHISFKNELGLIWPN